MLTHITKNHKWIDMFGIKTCAVCLISKRPTTENKPCDGVNMDECMKIADKIAAEMKETFK